MHTYIHTYFTKEWTSELIIKNEALAKAMENFFFNCKSLLNERCFCQMILSAWTKCACSFPRPFTKRQNFTAKCFLFVPAGRFFKMSHLCSWRERQWESRSVSLIMAVWLEGLHNSVCLSIWRLERIWRFLWQWLCIAQVPNCSHSLNHFPLAWTVGVSFRALDALERHFGSNVSHLPDAIDPHLAPT